jgi:hypothetical protein
VAATKSQSVAFFQLQSRRRISVFFIACMLWLNFLFFIDYREATKKGYTDFSVFYTAGTILRQGLGHQLYDRQVQLRVQQDFAGSHPFIRGPLPYIHPPFEAVIFVPLSFLSYRNAFLIWDLASIVMLFGVAAQLRPLASMLYPIPNWKFVLGSLAFFPIFMCLLQGQDSILQLLVFSLAFRALQRNSDLLSGCWLALGSFKFQFTIPIILLFLFWKRRRFVLGFAALALLLVMLSLGLVGTKSLLGYPGFALQTVDVRALGGVPLSLLPNLHGLAQGWPYPLSGLFGMALAAVASIGLFLFGAMKGRAEEESKNLNLQISLAVCVAVLVAWQTNVHDLSLLILPIFFAADYVFHQTSKEAIPLRAFLLPALPLFISPLWMVLWLGIGKVNLMVIPLLWWVWELGKELSRNRGNTAALSQDI